MTLLKGGGVTKRGDNSGESKRGIKINQKKVGHGTGARKGLCSSQSRVVTEGKSNIPSFDVLRGEGTNKLNNLPQ